MQDQTDSILVLILTYSIYVMNFYHLVTRFWGHLEVRVAIVTPFHMIYG